MPRMWTKMYWGFDPGKSGAIARLCCDSNKVIDQLEAWPMPPDEYQLWELIREHFVYGQPNFAVLEAVSSSPQMGVVSSFSFGLNFGLLRMVIAAHAFRCDEVRPKVWQDGLHIPAKKKHTKKKRVKILRGKNKGQYHTVKTGGDTDNQWKEKLHRRACQLFPDYEFPVQVADAILMAEYGRRTQ